MAEFEFTNKLLKEAIADAEAVRQTAIENAKLSLEETFTPQIKSMLSRRLRAEAEGMEHDEEEKEVEKKEAPEAEKEAPKAPVASAEPKTETARTGMPTKSGMHFSCKKGPTECQLQAKDSFSGNVSNGHTSGFFANRNKISCVVR